jgi:5-methyltetrahydrofolate corrinoid/iron sulfur protein methyltransferase
MYVIGERINGMFKKVRQAIVDKDKSAIQELARQQIDAGADALDVNVGPASSDRVGCTKWLIEAIREVSDVTLSVDDPRWEVQESGIPMVKGNGIINSCKADNAILDKYMPFAVENDVGLVALTIDAEGVPSNVDKRVELGMQIVAKAFEHGLEMHRLYIDPIILPVNVAPKQPAAVLEAMRQLKMVSDPPPNLILGLSNVSQKCLERHLINRTYTVMAISAGMNSVIFDPLDKDLMDSAITAELLMEKMIYCDSYLDAYLSQKQKS